MWTNKKIEWFNTYPDVNHDITWKFNWCYIWTPLCLDSKLQSALFLHLATNIQCFSFGFPLLSIVFHYFSKLFPISIKCQSDVNMK
jgi:hypothetical protein